MAYAIATLLNNLFGRRQGAVLAAGVHGSAEVRDLAAADQRGIHDAVGGVPLRHQRRLIDQNIRDAEGAVPRPAAKSWSYPTSDYETHPRERRGRCGRSWVRDADGASVSRRPRRIPRCPRHSVHRRKGTQAICADRRHRLEAIKRWFNGPWTKLDARSRRPSSKASWSSCRCSTKTPPCIARFVRRAIRVREPARSRASRSPLPPLEELLETGRVLGLNFPVALNPALARGLGVMLKLDFQRAVLNRIPKISANPDGSWRDMLFVADEYHAFATVGETDPTGDERAFALSRQARLIPIVATQSISSLRSALAGDEAWRTLLQCFRTKVFLATSDEFTAQRRRGTVRASRPAEGAVHHRRDGRGRAHLAAERPRGGRPAHARREQVVQLRVRLHLSAARLHGAAERAGGRVAVRRPQSAAAAVLLPEAALPRRANQLLRSRLREVRYEQP